MRLGIDSYSYHRLLGEIRPGEAAPGETFEGGVVDVLEEARRLAVAVVSLETCFLDPPDRLDAAALRAAAGPLELLLAWGHPHGLEFGTNQSALADLLAWIELAPRLGCGLVRLVAGSPRFRGAEPVEAQIERTAPQLAQAARRASELGVDLALENHADLSAAELLSLVERAGDPEVGVCLDTANLLRVGDDAVAATRLLAARVRMVHLKDVRPPADAENAVAGPASVPYGEGVVPLRAVLDELENAGFAGPLCVELGQLAPGADEQELVRRCLSWLRTHGYA
jgi:sugar phosphate isomerase/epimerase